MSLDYTPSEVSAFLPQAVHVAEHNTENFEPMSLCSITSDLTSLASAAAVNMCDPYWDLQVPGNHPLRSYLYGEGSRMMSNEALAGVTRIGDNRVSVRAVVGEGAERQKIAVDIARLPGGAYFVQDHVANSSTLYLGDNTKIKLLPGGQAIISTPFGMKTVKDSFLMKSGDSMIKINPTTGGVHVFSNDGSVTTITSPSYWTAPRREADEALPKKRAV